MRKGRFLAILVVLTAALLVYATRPADPAGKRIEYRPGAFFPAALELHGTVKRTSAPVVEMGKRTRIRVEYTVGEKAIEAGMAIEIWKHFTSDVEEFQVDDAGAPAFFGAEVTAAGVELATSKFSNAARRNTPTAFPYRKCARAAVTRGRLEQGDKVMFDIGGPKGVRMQSYEENLFNFRVALVRSTDGKLLGYGGDAYLKVIGGGAERLRVVAPAVAAFGEAFTVAAVPEDRFGSLARDHRGRQLRITGGDVGASPFAYDEDLMHYTARVVANGEGVIRIEVRSEDGSLRGASNPIWVEREPQRRVYYGDLHQHTYLADGRGTFEELYLYARRGGLLDFGALTPHHMTLGISGPILRLEGQEFPRDYWPELVEANKTMNGWKGFVPILGYEYSVGTKDGGHHNIYYEGDEAPTTMQTDPKDPRAPIAKMLRVLRRGKKRALVIPHIGGGPPDWRHETDPRQERLFEIASIHGVFEESWTKHLETGLRLAASASGDTHTTRFGNANPGLMYTMTNPLTGVWATEKTRAGIWGAMYEKRTFAVTGNTRMLVDFSVNGEPMGGELPPGLYENARIQARVSGTAPIMRVDLVKNGETIHRVFPARQAGKLLRVKWGDNLYLRRASPSLSTGELRAGAGRVRLRRAMHLDNSFEHIEQNGDQISWTTATTSNDREALLADISEASGEALHFQLDDHELNVEIPLAQLIRDGHFRWTKSLADTKQRHNSNYMAMMGVAPVFFLECDLVSADHPMDFQLDFEDRTAPASGDYYYLRVEQLDTNLAWSSPVWVN